jgi:ketosteroid isomerase-like protein
MSNCGDERDKMDAKSIVREYYIRLDSGRPDLLDLFSEDAQFYFPKFGIARGKSGFQELISGLLTSVASISHDVENFLFIVDGNRVAVEGLTRGRLVSGAEWVGGRTPGGRFSSIFEVHDGLITRMHVYLDPDYSGEDKKLFLWPNPEKRNW